VTQQNAAQTEELSATAQGLSTDAEQLQSLVTRFVLENERGGARPAAKKHAPKRPASRQGSGGTGAFSRNIHTLSRKVSSTQEQRHVPLDSVTVAADGEPDGGFAEF
jgi:hypothetical protein